MTSVSDLNGYLKLYRSTRAGATRLAMRIMPMVEKLRASCILLPVDETMRYLSQAIYFSADYDACRNYSSVEDFDEALREDVFKGWPEQKTEEGVEYFVLRPFFNDTPYLSEMRMGSLRGCSMEELAPLKVVPLDEFPSADIAGLSDDELVALSMLHRSNTLAIVNTIRFLATALTYPVSALSNLESKLAVIVDPGVEKLLADLKEALAVPGMEPPAAYFSSDWDKKFRLHDLPPDSALAAFLRDS